jgi:hypothetical protein
MSKTLSITTPSDLTAITPDHLAAVTGGADQAAGTSGGGNLVSISDEVQLAASGPGTNLQLDMSLANVTQKYLTKIKQFQLGLNL